MRNMGISLVRENAVGRVGTGENGPKIKRCGMAAHKKVRITTARPYARKGVGGQIARCLNVGKTITKPVAGKGERPVWMTIQREGSRDDTKRPNFEFLDTARGDRWKHFRYQKQGQ